MPSHHASARLRIVLEGYLWQLWFMPATAHTLRFYIRPHCPQCPAVTALKLRFVLVTATRPSGEGNRHYAKWPSLESVAQPSALPGRVRALHAAVCAPLWLS